MSQSPTSEQADSSLTRYRQGWKALNRLLHEQRSFSGNERNCAFLNMNDGKFASISSVSGLDLKDDGRAVAHCDWDFDGRPDLWNSARTAPRIRLMRNQIAQGGHFLALQLRGDGRTTNRDAIGARVEILADGDSGRSIRTLHAGSGFLTQSSRWLHFGLGEQATIKEIHVQWPGGGKSKYRGVPVNRFYLAHQEAGELLEWRPPASRTPLTPQAQRPPATSPVVRIIPPYRLPLPTIVYQRKGSIDDQRLAIDSPTLISVWSTTCTTCMQELSQWSQAVEKFRERGLQVVALNADVDATAEQVEQREQALQDLGFAFESLSPTTDSLRQIDYFQRALMDLWQPMPVPCTFLLDRWGNVVAIYKGPVALEQLWSDLGLCDAGADQLRSAGLPFPGRWASDPPTGDPMRVASQMIDHKQMTGAIEYLQQFFLAAAASQTNISQLQRADVQYMRAVLLESVGRTADAIEALKVCRRLNPSDYRVRTDLATHYLQRHDLPAAESELAAVLEIRPADIPSRRQLITVLLQQEKLTPAIEQLRNLLRDTPQDARAYLGLADTLRRKGAWAEAIESYKLALKHEPNFDAAANNLAWILATHPAKQYRDGALARQIAVEMCRRSDFNQPEFLDTLAAACAESGDFRNAVKAIDRALQILQGQAEGEASMQQRKSLYQQQKPYRDDTMQMGDRGPA